MPGTSRSDSSPPPLGVPEWACPGSISREYSNESGNEPLIHRLIRWVRTNDSCFSAMVYLFRRLQRLGLSVGPNHFYWPVPDLSSVLRRRQSETSEADLQLHPARQLQLLEDLARAYASEWTFPEAPAPVGRYHYNNGFFETVDAEMAYCFVRHFKPARIVEVGGGYSTLVLTEALLANERKDGVRGQLTTIDPGTSPLRVQAEQNGARHIRRAVQEVDLDLFLSLKDRDILFLDSSHVVSVGSDVVYEYLKILPRLQKGVVIHAHDIFIPFDYPSELINNLSFWSEQYLLLAFLQFNSCFEVLWGSSGMQLFHPDALGRTFPRWKDSYRRLPKGHRRFVPSLDGERIWPSSFWMRRIA